MCFHLFIICFLSCRFVFVIPAVTAPKIGFHVSHPPPTWLSKRRQLEEINEMSPSISRSYNIDRQMMVQFPETRLIQYDCGELIQIPKHWLFGNHVFPSQTRTAFELFLMFKTWSASPSFQSSDFLVFTGKLQTLDVLLRLLKPDKHRYYIIIIIIVLIDWSIWFIALSGRFPWYLMLLSVMKWNPSWVCS